MEEKELIQDTKKSYQRSVSFFSNSNKSIREIWVVNEFLKNLGINFQHNELKSISNDPPDVIFRDATFEIKEIDKEGRKRHHEYKKKLEKAKSATKVKDLMTPYEIKEIAIQEIVNRIEKKLREIAYSLDFCKKTNVLFYINYSLIGEHNYSISEKQVWEKWQSVSMVTNNNIPCIFWANVDAPEFIKSNRNIFAG